MAKAKTSQLIEVPYPAVPLEDLYVRHGFGRGLTSSHTQDLLRVAILFVAILVTVAITIWDQPEARQNILRPEVLAAMLTSFLAVFAGIYHLAKLRFSTVDVFSSEILARLRVIAADDTVGRIIRETDPYHVDLSVKRSSQGPSNAQNVLEPSSENHFETFHRRSNDLGVLSAVVVDHVTDFYSFQMAARDGLRELTATMAAFPTEAEDIRAGTISVMFMLDLMAYSGLRALEELIETKTHRLHARQIALCVGTRANLYLQRHMDAGDHRRPEIMRRGQKYSQLVAELTSAIRPPLLGGGLIPRGQEFF